MSRGLSLLRNITGFPCFIQRCIFPNDNRLFKRREVKRLLLHFFLIIQHFSGLEKFRAIKHGRANI